MSAASSTLAYSQSIGVSHNMPFAAPSPQDPLSLLGIGKPPIEKPAFTPTVHKPWGLIALNKSAQLTAEPVHSDLDSLLSRFRGMNGSLLSATASMPAVENSMKRKGSVYTTESTASSPWSESSVGRPERRLKLETMTDEELRERYETRLLRNRISARKTREKKQMMADVLQEEVNKLRGATKELETLVRTLLEENERLRVIDDSQHGFNVENPMTALDCAMDGC